MAATTDPDCRCHLFHLREYHSATFVMSSTLLLFKCPDVRKYRDWLPELGEVLRAPALARTSEEQITVVDPTGVAVQDSQ